MGHEGGKRNIRSIGRSTTRRGQSTWREAENGKQGLGRGRGKVCIVCRARDYHSQVGKEGLELGSKGSSF